ncbi:hypothetical protein [Hyunsoonleella pacifica]|uniref:Alpha/beta hydrolase n=1 Tax=Hyunsoonleella pacifica TaxID=1080224 RepID=A0A4Q9FTH2_9FLAO|nr:hypothetical protein [Hyunsoonleella pacifica]TBN18649.1 hypothetical protein EYD46_00865 [Hyunsoonleella pacifica]GGD03529.1 hypothetical protein GCM10011368_01720 [Hyunsoonleella pacifica]
METVDNFIFQIDNPEVKAIYTNAKNYKVKLHEGDKVQKDLCAIYFSSNELYYPNTSKAFQNSILVKDKFEWQRNFFDNAHKHIFIRDVQKQWYVEGISATHNSPDKLLKLLKELTQGYKIFTLGSSAGGYAAMLYGGLLKADRVYAFNAQLNLNVVVQSSNAITNPLLFKYKDSERAKFFKIDNFITSETDYFYFQSSKSLIDIKQYENFHKKEDILRVVFKTSNHGFPFLRHNLKHVLSLDKTKLITLSKKQYHPVVFAASVDGWFKTIHTVTTAVLKRFKKKLIEKKAKF